jgi:hypothetical protein
MGAQRLMDFVSESGLTVWPFDDGLLSRCFELMIQYADRPMDLADASLVALADWRRPKRPVLRLHHYFRLILKRLPE